MDKLLGQAGQFSEARVSVFQPTINILLSKYENSSLR